MIARVFIDKEDFEVFRYVVKEALEHFLNLNSNQSAEFLAKFLDLHLKKSTGHLGGLGHDDQLLESLITDVI